MVDTPPGAGSKGSTRLPSTVITDARTGTSREMASRQKRYAITMAIRTACFISMIFVPGPFRWVLLAAAVFLPYIAVVLANQANTRTTAASVAQAAPSPAPQITAGKQMPDLISGDTVTDDGEDGVDKRWTRHDRVG